MTPDELRAAGLPRTAAYQRASDLPMRHVGILKSMADGVVAELLERVKAEKKRAEMCEAWHIRYTAEKQRAEAAEAEASRWKRALRHVVDETRAVDLHYIVPEAAVGDHESVIRGLLERAEGWEARP